MLNGNESKSIHKNKSLKNSNILISQDSAGNKSQKTPSQNNLIKQLQEKYKENGYQTIPYIPNDQFAHYCLEQWEDSIRMAAPVPKENMEAVKFEDHSLLIGEVVMLWWMNRMKKKDYIPQYFLWQYGINFSTSLKKLESYGLATSEKSITNAGLNFLNKYPKIIKHHRAGKSWTGIGPVKYDYSKLLKGEEKKEAMLQNVQKAFDNEMKFYSESKIIYFQWMPSKNPCQLCKKLATTDNGWGKGVYRVADKIKVRKLLHYDCLCTTVPYDDTLPNIIF
ncbi:hypothetical protein PT281_02680 [Lactobacillus sp. ESL0701]|uniref:hypothetical protein n=1 Tax=Lactobacillus sp. ESL0701 TaxID=2983217 RepID=UPI0023F95C0E|nr:hypothetical protein [Lactobacillus sp. ESL0701]MDF7672193.1 hypothetical protein [Lactobacillus sp. ESL0701]